jgi:hypothetical protein
MPQEHVSYSFKFAELSEDAQSAAVEAVAGRLSGEWWDNDEEIGDTIRYKLAEVFQSPGWDKFGEGDFPGIELVKLEGWDLGRGDYLILRGRLDRVNAPGLPWSDAVGDVFLEPNHYAGGSTNVGVEEGDEELPEDVQRQACAAMTEAVTDAFHAALVAGREAMRYIGSEENAREHIEVNELDFNEDGSLFS